MGTDGGPAAVDPGAPWPRVVRMPDSIKMRRGQRRANLAAIVDEDGTVYMSAGMLDDPEKVLLMAGFYGTPIMT